MANWREKIDLVGLSERLTEEHYLDEAGARTPCPVVVREALAVEVEKSTILKPFKFGDSLRKVKTVGGVNRVLDRIYDAADTYKVWCGI